MFQLQTGYGKDILEYPKKVAHTDSTWYNSLIDAMVQYKISIKRPHLTKIVKIRESDISIMELFTSFTKLQQC